MYVVYSHSRSTDRERYYTGSRMLLAVAPAPAFPLVFLRTKYTGWRPSERHVRAEARAGAQLPDERRRARAGHYIHDSTFSSTVWRLYGGAKGLVVWY
jgi:hypothetical protein